MKLRLKNAQAVSLTKYATEEQTTQVLVVTALLTPPIAETLQCREACYTPEGVPRRFDAYPSPSARIEGADVMLGDDSFRANLITKFKIRQPHAGGDRDVSLEVQARFHFDGHLHLGDWLDNMKKNAFTVSINARQEDFNFGGDDAADEEEQQEEELDTGCVACNNKIPLSAPGVHTSGAKCTANKPGPALATAREAAGGTPGRGKRGQIAN